MKLKTKEITICGLFAALIAVGAFLKIEIPLPLYTMHFTLQWLFVLLAGLLLGAKIGTLSVLSYLLIGLIGIPVFAAGGGPAYVLRPGFGFLLGFLLAALVMGLMINRFNFVKFYQYLFAATVGLVAYYSLGAIYFYMIKNFYTGDTVSFAIVVVDYCLITVLPDFVLCVIASALAVRLKPVITRIYN